MDLNVLEGFTAVGHLQSEFLHDIHSHIYTAETKRVFFISASNVLLPDSDNWQYKNTVCPDGWIDHNGFCYRYVDEKGSWDNSVNTCKALGGQLTSILSLSEQELLLALLING